MLIQIVFLLIVVLALWFTWKRVRQNALRRGEGILWSLLWIALAIVVIQPEVASWLASTVGIGRGADLMVYGSIVILLSLVFHLQITIEKMERSITELVTRLAMKDVEDK